MAVSFTRCSRPSGPESRDDKNLETPDQLSSPPDLLVLRPVFQPERCFSFSPHRRGSRGIDLAVGGYRQEIFLARLLRPEKEIAGLDHGDLKIVEPRGTSRPFGAAAFRGGIVIHRGPRMGRG